MTTEATEATPGEGAEGGAEEAVDYEAEARKMGWTPPDEFKGDPKHFIDAETFYRRATEYMPIAKATIKTLSQKIDRMERDFKRASEHFSKAEERAYQRALADIRAKQEAAVEAGDLDAFREAEREAEELRKAGAKQANEPEEDEEQRRAEEVADWGRANKWYATNPIMQAYADSIAARVAKTKGGFLDRSDLDKITEKVKAKFPEEFEEDAPKPKAPKRSPVEGVSGARPTRGKTFADLPVEAQRLCDRWVKAGIIKSRDDYVKSYEW
jgi:hypothetical protein